MKGYILDYINENEFKKLERALKKYNMLAFKKLNFEYYPSLRNGEFLGELMSSDKKNDTETYELKLPSDHLFTQGHVAELTTYKGVMISKANADKDKFMINLFSAMDNK